LLDVAQEAADTGVHSLDALMQQPYSKDTSVSIDQHRALVVQSLGENIQVKRVHFIPKSHDVSVGIYSHMGGKIVTAVVLTGGAGHEALARDIAMHVAAEAPEYLRPEDVPNEIRAREEDIARSQVKGKPDDIAQKIVQGKYKAFCDEVCLLCQKYVKENTLTISGLLEKEGKHLGKAISISAYYRWKVGG
jgi:elongation factor Ts